jgi:hypothetical protein
MAVVIIATPGAADANSYATRAEATTYHEGHISGAAWAAAAEDLQNRALVTATRLLDAHVDWSGCVASSTQRLQWPRSGMLYRSGYAVPSDVIPDDLKAATAEFARQLLGGDRSADSDIETQGIERLKAGPVELAFRAGTTAKVIPDAVWYLVELWGREQRRNDGVIALRRSG